MFSRRKLKVTDGSKLFHLQRTEFCFAPNTSANIWLIQKLKKYLKWSNIFGDKTLSMDSDFTASSTGFAIKHSDQQLSCYHKFYSVNSSLADFAMMCTYPNVENLDPFWSKTQSWVSGQLQYILVKRDLMNLSQPEGNYK